MKFRRIIAFVLAALMLLSVFGCTKAENKNKGSKGEDGDAAAVWSDTTVITRDMFTYFFNGYYRYYLESNSSHLNSLGLDPSKALSSQKYNDEYNWQQYFVLQVYRQLREMIALADAAKEEGLKLSKEDKKEIKEQISAYDELAKQQNKKVADYIVEVYGKGVTKDTMEDALTVRYLANKYYTKLTESYSYTEDECLEYYNKNSNSFVHFDYLKLTVPPEDEETLTSCTDKESFIDAMRKIITKNNFINDYDRFADTIEAQLKKKQYYRADYDKGSDFCKWVVDEERKPYDIYTKKESTGNITVCMILPTTDEGAVNEIVYRDDMPLKNLKYMVFEDGEGTAGKIKAESIYKNWQEKGTLERFDELIKEYDGSTVENIARGEFTESISEWVFAEGRKAGDTGIVEVDGGAYLIYMLEDGEPSWITDVKAALAEEQYAEDMNRIMDEHPTEYDGDFVYSIVEVRAQSAAADTTAAE